MIKRVLVISFSVLLLTLPLAAWGADVPGKVYENGASNTPIAQSGVKVEVFGGYGFKTLLSSGESDGAGACLLGNLPLGKEVLVKMTKAGYVPQYDVRSYSEDDVEDGVILWVGAEANVNGLYSNLGETFDGKKGHVYLEISDELTEDGIEGIQLAVSSGKVFDLGQGEYLIANAAGASVKIGISKPGYAFDIESAAIPLYAGAITQYYVKVQSGGGIYANSVTQALTTAITGVITRVSDAQPVSGLTVAFVGKKTNQVFPSVRTNSQGVYFQSGFPDKTKIVVAPDDSFWRIKAKNVTTKVGKTKTKNFKAKEPK